MKLLDAPILLITGLLKPRRIVLSILIFLLGTAATYGDSILKLAVSKELFEHLMSGSATTQQLFGVPIVLLSIYISKAICAWAAGMLLISRYKRFGTLPFPSKSEPRK